MNHQHYSHDHIIEEKIHPVKTGFIHLILLTFGFIIIILAEPSLNNVGVIVVAVLMRIAIRCHPNVHRIILHPFDASWRKFFTDLGKMHEMTWRV